MCSRVGKDITMTIACAMVDRFIDDPTSYKSAVEDLTKSVQDFGAGIIDKYGDGENLVVDVNTGDDYERGVYYLTVTGLSQEMGDDGSVGRGNRCNGLITPFRPMSMEATSGKNPITHVGKIYNVLSTMIAKDVAKKVKADAEIHVRLLSQIGHTISDPLNANIDIINENAADSPKLNKWKDEVYEIAADWLDNIDKVSELIINGKIETTEGKAMELRSYVDSVITTAKKNDLAARRQAINELSNIKTKDGKTAVQVLFDEVAVKYADRKGGYTRVTKTYIRRGDNAPMATVELV